jgi:carbamoyltransferase
MKILGVWDGHNATACLTIDGKIDSCISEERFTRVKNCSGFPGKSIKFVLEHANVKSEDIDIVVLASNYIPVISMTAVGDVRNTLRKTIAKVKPVEKVLYKGLSGYFFKKRSEERIQQIIDLLKIDRNKIVVGEHHILHSYAAYFGSGFKKALVLTLDGEGDGLCGSVSIGENEKLERITTINRENSIGLLWARVTEYLGMKAVEDEWKVMGLAPYAKNDKAYEIFKQIISVEDGYFKSTVPATEFEKFLQKNLYKIRFDIIAYGLQKLTEELVLKWVEYWANKTGINDIAVSGGVFMNVKVNMLLSDIYKNVFVFPSSGDESLAIGACYYGSIQKGFADIEPLGSIYFGPEYSDEEIEYALKKHASVKFDKIEKIEKKIAELLAKGEIVAVMNGKMEWGARALGNRSILADATNFENIKRINEAIKKRDFWMPFAPAILEERIADYAGNPKKSPYMILAFRSTEKGKKDLMAATHQYDNTLRPQTVTEESNPRFYRIIKEFENITGRGGFLNTSFNLHGFPIVMNPEDALYVFENSGLEYLVMNNYLVTKN